MLEFLLALLTTATVGALLVPLLQPRLARADRLDERHSRSIATSSPRSSASAPPAPSPPPRPTPRAPRSSAACSPPPTRTADAGPRHRRASRLAPLPAAGALPRRSRCSRSASTCRSARPACPSAPFVARIRTHRPAPPPPTSRQALAQAIAAARARLAQQPDDPEALSALGEALTQQADGVVTPAAASAFRRALAKQPDDPRALFYLGLHEAQGGDSKAALARWRALEQQLAGRCAVAADAARRDRARRRAGRTADPAAEPRNRRPRLADRPRGSSPACRSPTQDQVQAMQNLPPAERQQAIRGMVAGLEQRLAASQPATPAARRGSRGLAAARQCAAGAGRGRQGRRGLCEGRCAGAARAARCSPTGPRRRSASSSPARRPRPPPSRCWSGWRRPSPATRWRCSISAPPPSPKATSQRRAALEDAAGAAAARRADPEDAEGEDQGSGGALTTSGEKAPRVVLYQHNGQALRSAASVVPKPLAKRRTP